MNNKIFEGTRTPEYSIALLAVLEVLFCSTRLL